MLKYKVIFAGKLCISFIVSLIINSCVEVQMKSDKPVIDIDTTIKLVENLSDKRNQEPFKKNIQTFDISPGEVLAFARTLIGIPYLYASTDPKKGFDCSGFITYVFDHFNISVPRSSVDFTNVEKEVSIHTAMPGDLILFTGTDSTIRTVGHMGIVENIDNGRITFIHSTSGKARGVVITEFGDYYKSRFVKVIRIFPDYFFNN